MYVFGVVSTYDVGGGVGASSIATQVHEVRFDFKPLLNDQLVSPFSSIVKPTFVVMETEPRCTSVPLLHSLFDIKDAATRSRHC